LFYEEGEPLLDLWEKWATKYNHEASFAAVNANDELLVRKLG